MLAPLTPSYHRLNYVIAMATVDSTRYLLDPTENYMPFNLIPFRCLNYNGRTAVETGSKPVEIVTNRKDKKVTMYNVEILDDLNLRGDISVMSTDYAALDFRNKYHTFNSKDEYLEDFKKDKVGLNINDSQLDNIDNVYKPVLENYKVTISNKVNSLGSDLYILPMLFDQITENPFKADVRKYPIDYGYKFDKTVITTIKIPAGYTIKTLPSKIFLKMPDNSASYIFEAFSSDTEIKISGRYMTDRSLILPEHYLNFREFYNQIIKIQSEPVILKKI
jgi:hypothetical protein